MAEAACTSRSVAGETPSRPRQLGRKRVRHETEWRQADRKAKRNSGQEYVNKKKTVSPTVTVNLFSA